MSEYPWSARRAAIEVLAPRKLSAIPRGGRVFAIVCSSQYAASIVDLGVRVAAAIIATKNPVLVTYRQPRNFDPDVFGDLPVVFATPELDDQVLGFVQQHNGVVGIDSWPVLCGHDADGFLSFLHAIRFRPWDTYVGVMLYPGFEVVATACDEMILPEENN